MPLEPQGLCTGSDKRPDGVTQISGHGVAVWLGMPPARTRLPNLAFRRAVHVPVQRQKRQKRRKLKHTPTSL